MGLPVLQASGSASRRRCCPTLSGSRVPTTFHLQAKPHPRPPRCQSEVPILLPAAAREMRFSKSWLNTCGESYLHPASPRINKPRKPWQTAVHFLTFLLRPRLAAPSLIILPCLGRHGVDEDRNRAAQMCDPCSPAHLVISRVGEIYARSWPSPVHSPGSVPRFTSAIIFSTHKHSKKKVAC